MFAYALTGALFAMAAAAGLGDGASTASAEAVNVQGTTVRFCDAGESTYGTDFLFLFSADGQPLFSVSSDPDKPVLPDGSSVSGVHRIPGTNSFFLPEPKHRSGAQAVYTVEEIIPGGYVVTSVMACDYGMLHDRSGYKP
jgi:hypothetical protein